MGPGRHENDKKISPTARNKKTILNRLKSVQRNECEHRTHGRGPENNDVMPDFK